MHYYAIDVGVLVCPDMHTTAAETQRDIETEIPLS